MWTCNDLRAKARLVLTGKYWWAVLWTLVYTLLAGMASSIVSVISTFVFQSYGFIGTIFMESSSLQETSGSITNKGVPASFFPQIALFILIFIAIILLMYAAIFAVMIFLTLPLSIGYQKWYFDIREGGEGKRIDPLFTAFRKNTYGRLVRGMAWKMLWSFLWALVGAIPIIISFAAIIVFTFSLSNSRAGFSNSETILFIILTGIYMIGFGLYAVIIMNRYYAYTFTSYLLIDDPSIEYREALKKSIAMSKGQKLHMLGLDLSFIGWWILVALTCGYGSLFLIPYLNATQTELYFARKAEMCEQHKESNE
jgi:uncharacterized membrane protein